MFGRLVALDKQPGIRPIGIGETWRRLFAKCVLRVAGTEAEIQCGADQLCAGLKAGIDGAVHAMSALWEELRDEEEHGFLLVDARNAFNELNRTRMLWTVRHLWPSGARFTFNCYRHHTALFVRTLQGEANIIPSREGVTQGDPLAMIAYGIAILPLIRELKVELADVTQPWFADDGAGLGTFDGIRKFFRALAERGPAYGYFPEPSKSRLIVGNSDAAVNTAKEFFLDENFDVVCGYQYLGGYIGAEESKIQWIENKIAGWSEGVTKLTKVADRNPQSAYVGLQRSYQQE